MRIRSGGFGWHLAVLTLEPNEISFKSFMSDRTRVLLNDSPPTSLNGESLEIRDGSPRFEMDFLSISFLQSPRFLSWGQKMHAPPKKFRDDSEISGIYNLSNKTGFHASQTEILPWRPVL